MIKPITVDGRGKQNLIDIPFEYVYVCERGKIKILIFAYAWTSDMIARRIVRIHSKKDLWFFYLFFIFSWEANFIFNDSRMCILKSNKVAWPEYFSKTCTSLETWKNWSRAFNMFFLLNFSSCVLQHVLSVFFFLFYHFWSVL